MNTATPRRERTRRPAANLSRPPFGRIAMPTGSTAYLVIRRDDGFGDVFELRAGARYTIGRATTNRVVLKDEMCSREHAEVVFTDQRWYVRDLNSLNATRLTGK